jgi:hypothetical protein
MAVRAEAIPMLTNVTEDAALFTDDFEGQTVGQMPTCPPWNSVGTYGTAGNSIVETCDYASEGVAAYQGEKFVKLYRPDVSGGVYLEGISDNSDDDSGDTIRLEIAFRIDGTESSIYAIRSNGTPLAEFGLFGNGDVCMVTADLQNWVVLNQKANVGEWNVLVVEHVNGVDSWSVSVNGATPETGVGFTGQSDYDWKGICMKSDNRDSTGYWDAVPEPATMSLLVLGGLSVLIRRKR